MRTLFYSAPLALLIAAAPTGAGAQTAGMTKLGVTVVELADVIKGWSVQRQILGRSVQNDKGEDIGRVEDIIITPDRAASYAIISTGGFLGIGTHDVAIPASQFKLNNDQLTLPGATREQVKAMPPFEYVRK